MRKRISQSELDKLLKSRGSNKTHLDYSINQGTQYLIKMSEEEWRWLKSENNYKDKIENQSQVFKKEKKRTRY